MSDTDPKRKAKAGCIIAPGSTPADRLVLRILVDHANPANGICWPSENAG